MEDEWRYLVNTRDCYISLSGDVTQDGRLLTPYRRQLSGRHRWVDLVLDTNTYDYENGGWERGTERQLVWQLMVGTWFTNWPSDGELFFVDDDPWNCSANNIRSWSRRMNRVIEVRDDGYLFAFDKRLRGKVEIIELNQVVSGVAEAARIVGGTKSGVSFVLSGRFETHRGYHFRWISG